MNDKDIARINELSKLSKERELTSDEKEEQQKLRQEYVSNWKSSVKATLDNTYIDDGKGNITKLPKKKK